MLGDTFMFHLFYFIPFVSFSEYFLCVLPLDVLMSISRRVRDPSSGTLVDPRQLTLELLPCAAAGVFKDALLPPAERVEVTRLRSGRVRRSGPGRPLRPALWQVYWMPLGEVPPVGDPDHVRVAIPWGK